MSVTFFTTPAAFRTPNGKRALAVEYAPVLLLLFATWVKLFYVAIPQGEAVAESWYHFSPRLAVQGGVANFAAVVALAAPLLLFSPMARLAAFWLLNVVVTTVVLSNVLNLRFFGDILSVSASTDASQLPLVIDSIITLLRPTDALLFVDIAAAIALVPWYARRVHAGADAGRPLRRALAGRAAVLGGAMLLLIPAPIVALDLEETFRYDFFRFIGARQIGVLNYHFYEGGRSVYRGWLAGQAVSDEDRRDTERYLREWRATAAAPSEMFGVAKGKNVILVMVEALHSFPIGMRVEGREVTPNLNRLAGQSIYFENFYRQAWDGRTADGEFISLQSLHPLPAGAVTTTYPTHNYRGLPEILAERGYSTMAAHAYYGTLWNKRDINRSLGFQRMYFREDYRGKENVGLGLGDADFFPQTVPMLKRERAPFMGYLVTLSTHHPYNIPLELKKFPVPGLEGTLLGDYLHTVHYLDAALGDFVKKLEEEGLLDESVLVVYGDHDAQLGPPEDLEKLLTTHAGFGRRAPGFDARYWREENRLPLIVRLPNGEHAGVRTTSAGHVDVAPTVLGLLGIGSHDMVMLGRDLTQGRDAPVFFRDGSFVLGDTVCLPRISGSGCSDVRTGSAVDPAPLQAHFAGARRQLEVSDMVLMGDLIPLAPVREQKEAQ
jgi:phosphoglycerol transferase MdoB-like AlkP superfamily enzyme